MRQYTSRVIGAALCAAQLAGCSDSRESPLAPGTLVPEAARSVIQSIRIDGPATLAPGATARYTATAQFSDGFERDVTARTIWRSSDSSVLTIVEGGRANGETPGQAVIAAEAGGQQTSFEVLVLAPGTFRLTGSVSEGGRPIADAVVELLDGSRVAMTTRSNASGVYALFGVAGAVDVRVSKDGYATQVNHLVVTCNAFSDFVLTSGPTMRSANDTRRLSFIFGEETVHSSTTR
jgi:hypothetical protein